MKEIIETVLDPELEEMRIKAMREAEIVTRVGNATCVKCKKSYHEISGANKRRKYIGHCWKCVREIQQKKSAEKSLKARLAIIERYKSRKIHL